jgi:hypothetical protein
MGRFTDWFEGRKTKPLHLTGYVYEAERHSGWGDRLDWFDYDKRRISGHLQRKPVVGDEVLFRMSSGKTARYAVTSVEYCGDPRDMFFADVMDIGYEGDEPLNPVVEAEKREIEPRKPGIHFLV